MRAGGADRGETAAYVAAITVDLERLARRSGLPTLAYLLGMARLEAETESRGPGSDHRAGDGQTQPSG